MGVDLAHFSLSFVSLCGDQEEGRSGGQALPSCQEPFETPGFLSLHLKKDSGLGAFSTFL